MFKTVAPVIISLVLLLAAYLLLCAWKQGVPDMISDTYYLGAGNAFTFVMAIEALGLLVCTLTSGTGTQWLATLGCLGLLSVAAVPCYLHCGRCHAAHKTGAAIAAIGCVSWCFTVCWPVPCITLFLYLMHLVWSNIKKPWYVAEVCAFLCIFVTLLITNL